MSILLRILGSQPPPRFATAAAFLSPKIYNLTQTRTLVIQAREDLEIARQTRTVIASG